MEIAQKIKMWRVAKNYTQKDMAIFLKVTQPQYSNWENGKSDISAKDLYTVSQILEVPIQEFFPAE